MDGTISEGRLDLFGLPMVAERGRGRPAHVWTEGNSNKVNLMFACGWKPIEVARVLGITKPTFYKHYFNELARAGHAPKMMKARQLERLNKAAEDGNVAAEKTLAAMIHAEQVRALGDRVADRGHRQAEPAPLGKKETARAAAKGMVGRFETRAAPPGAIN